MNAELRTADGDEASAADGTAMAAPLVRETGAIACPSRSANNETLGVGAAAVVTVVRTSAIARARSTRSG